MGKRGNNPEAEVPVLETVNIEGLVSMWEAGALDLLCVLGPTASGKTRYAVALARKLDALLAESRKAPRVEIISADSRQVYRGMDIGTGKDLEEYGEIPYHLIDIVDAGEKYDLFRYQADFEKVYREIRERGNIPLLCGGTGLYIQAVTEAFHLPDVPADPGLRAELEEADIEELREAYAERTEPDPEVMVSKKRLIRALEVLLSGRPVQRSDYQPKRTFFIGLYLPKEQLHAKIAARLKARLESGMVEEVKGLLESGLGAEDLIYYGLEYKFITYYLTGVMDRETMAAQLEMAIRHFAKRQMTFFRSMESKGTCIHWTDPS